MEPKPVPAAPPALAADVRVPWHASLRTRLMLWVGLLLALLLLAGFATAFFAARERVIADAEARTRYEAKQAADRLDATMRSARVSGEAMIELSNRVSLTRAELLEAMEAMLDANPATVGGLVALEPGVLADRAPLAITLASPRAACPTATCWPTVTTWPGASGTSARCGRHRRGGPNRISTRPPAGAT